MPYFPWGTGQVIDDDTDGSASNPALQLPATTGTRAPQSTPAGGNTPRNNSPRNDSPGQTIDAESYAYGHVSRWYGDNNMDEIHERVEIELVDGARVDLVGAKARKARQDASPFRIDLPVQVIYFGATNEVKEIRRWDGIVRQRMR